MRTAVAAANVARALVGFLFLLAMASPASAAADTPPFCSTSAPELAGFERIAATDGWFEVFRLDPTTYAIVETRQIERIISYLLIGEQRALLFDTGFGIGRIDRVVAQLTPLPVTVLNSHSHYDHVGGNSRFSDIAAVDSAFGRDRAKGAPNAEMAFHIQDAFICKPLPPGVSATTYHLPPYAITRTIADGERIDLGGRMIEVVRTPGHTPDSIVVLDCSHGQMLTGDTFYPGDLWLFVPETDLAAYKASLARLVALAPEFRVLRPAHGVPTADPQVLAKVLVALGQVEVGTAKFDARRDRRSGVARRIYHFEGFDMLTQDPPRF